MKHLICLLTAAMAVSTTAQAKGLDEQLELPDFNTGNAIWIVRTGASFNTVSGSNVETQRIKWENTNYDGSFNCNTGYDFAIGFNKSFGNNPLYWGMELGLGTRGYKTSAEYIYDKDNSFGGHDYTRKTSDETFTCYTARFSPFTIGYKYTFLSRMAADIHFGAYASYDFAGNYKIQTTRHRVTSSNYGNQDDFTEESQKYKISDMDNMHKYDVGFNLGIGYWYGHFNIDFTWQRGCIPLFKGGNEEVSVGNKKSQKRQRGDFFANNFELRIGYAF